MQIAIIGTRTPSKLDYEFVKLLCAHLATLQHLVRTGGAVGIDAAAIAGVNMADHRYVWIYEPWPHFADGVASELNTRIRLRPEWLETVGKYHPNPYALSPGGRKLMARNFGIIAWPNRVDLVIACPGGTGGTWQGIRIAQDLGVPVRLVNTLHGKRAVIEMLEDWAQSTGRTSPYLAKLARLAGSSEGEEVLEPDTAGHDWEIPF